MSRTRKLDTIEIRVLGVLLEKEQTTPDQYPLTTNAVLAGCNQKTNRDPVLKLTETEVTEALDRLRQDVLVWRNEGARAERWQHSLDRRWALDAAAKAVMTLLLLRGPQTVGELRTRSERMHSFASAADAEATLRRLAEGFDALVCELPRQPGQRETRWMHLESVDDDPRDLAEPADPAVAPPDGTAPAETGPRTAATPAADRAQAAALARAEEEQRRAAFDQRLERLESAVTELQEQMHSLRSELGIE